MKGTKCSIFNVVDFCGEKDEIDIEKPIENFENFSEESSSSSCFRLNTYERNDHLSLSSISISTSISDGSETSIGLLNADKTLLNLACTNARSIVEKVDSLVTLFEENCLHLAMVTETWLSPKKCSKRSMDDLLNGANISFIRKDRGSRGGGVAICYDGTKIRMTNLPVPQNGDVGEIVCSIGSTSLTKRKVASVAVYLPPSIRAADLNQAMNTLTDLVNRIKTKYSDAILFIGGDYNNKQIDPFLNAFPCLKPLLAGATRNGSALDEVYTNMDQNIVQRSVQPPLQTIEGVRSDHSIIAASLRLPRTGRVEKKTFKFRPITTDGVGKFGSLLASKDWEGTKGINATVSANNLEAVLRAMIEECFPEKTRSIRSTDAPWFNNGIKKANRKKMRIYKAEGKSVRYMEAKKAYDKLVKKAKKCYLGSIIDKIMFAGNTQAYYSAVKLLKTKEAPKVWDIRDLFPGLSDFEISENVAGFFNGISQEYTPIPNPKLLEEKKEWPKVIETHQVAARLRTFKKTKSQVPGDISPDLVSKFYDLLAIPLAHIFNQALGSREWPELWKQETVTVIPKNSCPASMSELRNLSCTPLFSKVMESFILERLKSEIQSSANLHTQQNPCTNNSARPLLSLLPSLLLMLQLYCSTLHSHLCIANTNSSQS